MSRDLINNGNRANYGATDGAADVTFAGFSPTEFYTLCENITTNIYTVTSSWKNLERALKTLGTSRDNQAFRENIHVSQLSTNQIVGVTTKDVLRLNMIVRKGDKPQKLQVDKLSSDFKDAVARYSSFQVQVANKMKAHMLTTIHVPDDEDDDGQETDDQTEILKQQQLAREIQFEHEMMLEQESRIQQIEADVLDVNEIMKELGSFVSQQGEVIDTIENCIETATGNIEQGNSELQKAATFQNKFRRKLCILVVVAVIIVGILVGVLVATNKR